MKKPRFPPIHPSRLGAASGKIKRTTVDQRQPSCPAYCLMNKCSRDVGCRLTWDAAEHLLVRDCSNSAFHRRVRRRGELSGGARSPQPAQRLAGKLPTRADRVGLAQDQRSCAFATPDLQSPLDRAGQVFRIDARMNSLQAVEELPSGYTGRPRTKPSAYQSRLPADPGRYGNVAWRVWAVPSAEPLR